MRKRHILSVIIMVMTAVVLPMALLAGCGSGKGNADQTRTMGIDGYVFVPELLSGESFTPVSGLFTVEAPEVSFSPAKVFVKDKEGNFYFLSCNYSMRSDGSIYILEGINSYTLYEDGRLVKTVFGQEDSVTTDAQEWEEVRERVHMVLYKTSPSGEILYKLDLADRTWGTQGIGQVLAVLEDGTVMVLAKEGILLVDGEGNFAGLVDTNVDGINGGEEQQGSRYLVKGMDDRVFYVASDSPEMMVYEVVQNGTFSLSRAETFTGKSYGKIYPGLNGILFSSGGVLYSYTGKNSKLAPLLKWQDSNFYEGWIHNVVQVSEEEFLVDASADYSTHAYYRLKRTPLEELPEKEILVVASRWPQPALERTISEFNLLSPTYHVVLEKYEEEDRLDAALVGKNPPDILDLADLDYYKYADKGVLEDLTGYLAESSVIHKEDFLDNVVRGYTVDDRLCCIPLNFNLRTYVGRTEQVGDSRGWTMEECKELMERYPETSLVQGRDAGWFLQFLCKEYCLDRFVDWDERKCSFDSQEFREFLEWLLECGKRNERLGTEFKGADWEDSLLELTTPRSVESIYAEEAGLGKELTIIGFPTADGEECHLADVYGTLAIVSKSANKEGAWSFLEHYLSEYHFSTGDSFPTKKEDFWGRVEFLTTPEYELDENGERMQDVNGAYILKPKGVIINDELIYCMEKEELADTLEAIEKIDFTPPGREEGMVMGIVKEEAEDYFSGIKKADEVADIIQNRVTVLLGES